MQKAITNWEQVPVYVDLPLAARILGRRSPEYLKKLCQQGKFPGFKDGRFWLVKKEDLQAYAEKQKSNTYTLDI